LIGTTLKQRFVIERELGRGGMGAVYKATDQVLQRSVAIKMLRELSGDEVGRRIRLEAQILARLLHDNIVRLYDFDVDDGTFYFIMEEVDGTSFLKRWKKITIAERLVVLAQVADALDYAHRQGVIHRDIKPANVLLTLSDQAKLSDFGLSVMSDSSQETGIVRGTPHYMSPEQAKGKRLDHRSDLYSLGVLLYECVTGSPPFTGPAMTIMSQHVHGTPVPPQQKNPDVSVELASLIGRLLAKNPEARPHSGKEVGELLRNLAGRSRQASAGGPPTGGLPTNGNAGPPSVSPASWSVTAPAASLDDSRSFGASMADLAAPMEVAPALVDKKAIALARRMIDQVVADPVVLSPEERYLTGHYLAYLLGGSRRKGFLRRRPLDPLNADRARLMLAMTYLSLAEADDETVTVACELLDKRPEVRPSLSPIVVAKYLAARDQPGKRKRFRNIRARLQQGSEHAAKHLTDAQGVLNPGLMPQVLSDLKHIAPERTEVDDQLVVRWNHVADVWRGNPRFRDAVLRYATNDAYHDPASIDLWPEVVYPLIERARWQRRLRSVPEVLWDRVCDNLHIPDAGNRLDQAIKVSVPEQVAAQLDVPVDAFEEDPDLGAEPEPVERETARVTLQAGINPASFNDIDVEEPTRGFVRLASPDPMRHTLGDLRTLFQEAVANLRTQGGRQGHRHVPVGPYRLSVVASIRARSAGLVTIQGMPNKQIEMHVPSFVASGVNAKPVLAAWLYQNNSMVITYIDNLHNQRYICWDAANAQQTNFEDAASLNHTLYQLGLEVPDALDRVLTKKFQPQKPV
jgi:serine/threonine-protein kinase